MYTVAVLVCYMFLVSGVVSDRKETPVDYWESEHHRFEHSEYAPMLCQLNALSYHQMGLAVPGTFVEEGTVVSNLRQTLALPT